MGKLNSSTTRVVPVFNGLMNLDPTGEKWLLSLMRLGSRYGGIRAPDDPGTISEPGARHWGEKEKRLAPSKALLERLACTLTPEQVLESGDTGPVRDKRLALAERDPATVLEAVEGIHANQRKTRKWFLLEGPSCPDAFIQTNTMILVVEGKRTEAACTAKTKWMGARSQVLRHMDAASEIANGRRVFGLLIVEGEHGYGSWQPSKHWLRQSDEQVSVAMVEASLPHRSEKDRLELINGYLGVTTWQSVCYKFGLPWPPYKDPD